MHPHVLKNLNDSGRGAIMPGLNRGLIKELVVPVPPLSLQEKYVTIVQKSERFRRQQSESERQAEHLFQTTLYRSFQGELSDNMELLPSSTPMPELHNGQTRLLL